MWRQRPDERSCDLALQSHPGTRVSAETGIGPTVFATAQTAGAAPVTLWGVVVQSKTSQGMVFEHVRGSNGWIDILSWPWPPLQATSRLFPNCCPRCRLHAVKPLLSFNIWFQAARCCWPKPSPGERVFR